MGQALGRVFVTGGSGFVGRRMIAMLRDRGAEVTALARGPASAAKVEAAGARAAVADPASPAILAGLIADCQTVIHVAGHLRGWDSLAAFRASNVELTRSLLDAARLAGVRAFVQVGASAVVLGEPRPMLGVDERLPLQYPTWGPYIATKARAEALVLGADGPALRTCVVRPPFIWGPGAPMLDAIAANARSGQLRFPDGGAQPMSTCHVDNVCHGALLAAERGRGGEAYFLSDGADSAMRAVLTALVATRGVEAGERAIPFGLAWRLCAVMEPIWRLTRGYRAEPPITRQVLRMVGQPFTLDIGKARRELGYTPVVTWAEGIRVMTALEPRP
jgi:nucleoside-diphosphate-sugar epimerase